MYPLSDARPLTAPAERIAGLDGVRAFAVIVVLWYHAELKGALAAGFLGVDVFFVLSGFLITALLIREHEQSGRIAIGLFYLRRARRLLPALLLTVLLSAVAALLVAPDAVSPLRGDVIASLGYVSNWWQIYSNQSYFASVGRPPLLQHLWSLGIEEQFYVLWPLTLAFVLRRSARAWLAALCAFLAGASTLWMGYLAVRHGFPVEADASRVYFGTDTHAMGLFVGAAGAALVNPWREQRPLSRWRLAAVHWVGFGSLIALIASCCYWRDDTEVLYRGGFLLVSVLSLVLILSASVRGSSLERLFNTPLVVWLGTRSYGLYLFHWPVFALLRPEIDVPFGGYGCFVVRIVTVCLLTELCYRYVERPIRSVHFWPLAGRERKRVGVTGLLAALCFITVATLLYTTSAPSGSVPSDVAAALGVGVNGVPPSALLVSAKPPDFDEDEAGSGADAPVGARRLSSPDVFGESRWVLALGDSVFLGAARAFQNAIDHVQVDAQVGRQARDMVVRLAQLRDGGLLAPQVVIHLGTNGYVTEQQAQRILDALADRERVIVVNASAPRRWVDDNNAMLRRVVQGRANVVLLDWQQLAEGHADYFVSDRVHLTPIGLKVLSREICLLGGFKAPQRLPNFDGDRLPEDVIVTVLGAEQSDPGNAGAAEGVDELLEGGVARASGLPRNDKPMAPDRYWDRIADCETGGNWGRVSRFGGGLGMYVGSWATYGGAEFGENPGNATRDQQILVANRLSTQGWWMPDGHYRPPVGFSGWGCVQAVGRPVLLVHAEYAVSAQPYTWEQRGGLVQELQALLGVKITGVYDEQTRAAHRALVAARKQSFSLVPTMPSAEPVLLGLPKSDADTIARPSFAP